MSSRNGDKLRLNVTAIVSRKITRQYGFTLIELVVVIAILGILAAIAVPVISSQLGISKERAYEAEQSRLQVAVDAYYTSPANERYLGKRQYPIFARNKGGIHNAKSAGELSGYDISSGEWLGATSTNPVGGTRGGNPDWEDGDGDGARSESGHDELYIGGVRPLPDGNVDHWNTTPITLEGQAKVYEVDSRDWFIDFKELVHAKFLEAVPKSASADNDPDATGSYSWYVDENGQVKSLYYYYPVQEKTGYQGAYP